MENKYVLPKGFIYFSICLMLLALITLTNIKQKHIHLPYYSFDGGTFPIEINVFVTEDTMLVKSFEPAMDFNSEACTVYGNEGQIVVWFPKIDGSFESRLTVIHEMQHVNSAILLRVGVKHSFYTDEVYSYELEYLVKEFYKTIK